MKKSEFLQKIARYALLYTQAGLSKACATQFAHSLAKWQESQLIQLPDGSFQAPLNYNQLTYFEIVYFAKKHDEPVCRIGARCSFGDDTHKKDFEVNHTSKHLRYFDMMRDAYRTPIKTNIKSIRIISEREALRRLQKPQEQQFELAV